MFAMMKSAVLRWRTLLLVAGMVALPVVCMGSVWMTIMFWIIDVTLGGGTTNYDF